MPQQQASVIFNGYDRKPRPHLPNPTDSVIIGLRLKATEAYECIESSDLEQPGDYCYKNIAIAGTPEPSVKSVSYKKTVIINCPFCNRTKFLTKNQVSYELPASFATTVKQRINVITLKILNKEWFDFRGKGVLTVNGEVDCENRLHRYTITQNKIQMIDTKQNGQPTIKAT